MSDGQLLRNLARLQSGYAFVNGYKPDDKLISQVDMLVTAGDLGGAWDLLESRQLPAELIQDEVKR